MGSRKRSLGTSLFGMCGVSVKTFPFGSYRKARLCGKGGAAARKQRAEWGACWGSSHGAVCLGEGAPVCAREVCAVAPGASHCGRTLPGPLLRASWHPVLRWLFWALAVFRLGDAVQTKDAEGAPGSLIPVASAPAFSLKGSWSLGSEGMVAPPLPPPLARAFTLGTFLTLSIRIVVLLLSNRFVFTSWTQNSRTGQVSFLPLATGKLRAR